MTWGAQISFRPTEKRVWPLDIVLVDDESGARSALASALRESGHTCPDVVSSDWEMPGMSRLELCHRMRDLEDGAPYTYFILMTGHGDHERLMTAMESRADDFQKKRVDLGELEARLVLASRVVAHHRRLGEQATALRRDSQ